MKIYLEYKDNNSYKFWEVSVEGDYWRFSPLKPTHRLQTLNLADFKTIRQTV